MAEFCAVVFAVLFSAVQECRRPEPAAVRGAPRRSRRSKYSDAVRQACLSYWHAAKRTAEVRAGVNTRTTYKAAFEYFRRALVEIGVKTVEAFKRIIHAVQSRECEARRKDLEAKRDTEAKGGKLDVPDAKPMRFAEKLGRALSRLGIPLPAIFTRSDNHFK